MNAIDVYIWQDDEWLDREYDKLIKEQERQERYENEIDYYGNS